MDLLEAIHTRRSIRRFTSAPVPEGTVETLLRAAMAAPSAGNQQVWRFVVLRSPDARRAVAAANPHAGMLAEAPLGIVVCADTAAERYPGFWVQDCSAAIQNILLAAHAAGYGAVWLGYHPREDRVEAVQEALGIPRDVRPLGVVAVGRPAEEKGRVDRYDPDKVHHERWQGSAGASEG